MSDADNRRNATLSVGLVSKYQKAAPIAKSDSIPPVAAPPPAAGSPAPKPGALVANPVVAPLAVPVPSPLITEVAPRVEFAIGKVLAGKYRLERALGVGGMGAVWVALNTMTDAEVALKVLHEEVENPEALARFRREAHLAAKLQHRGIVRVFDLIELKAGTLAMVMEILRGETLADRLDRDRILPPAEAIDITLAIASALAHAHSLGIVHRDLKPENVFLVKEPDGHIEPKILDFGISKMTGPAVSNLTMDGTLLGTPGYMSPEQARGDEVDGRSDLFVLGILLYEMISGDNPFTAGTYNAVIAAILEREPEQLAAVTPEVWAVIERTFSKRRVQRFGSAADFAHALRLAAGLPVGNASFHEINGPASGKAGGAPAVVHAKTPKAPTSAMTMQEVTDDGSRPVDSGLSASVLPRASRPLVVGGLALAFAALLGVAALVRTHRQEAADAEAAAASASAASAATASGTSTTTATASATAAPTQAATAATAATTAAASATTTATGGSVAAMPNDPSHRSGQAGTPGSSANAGGGVSFPLQDVPVPGKSTPPATGNTSANAGTTNPTPAVTPAPTLAPTPAPAPTLAASAQGVHTIKNPGF